MNQNEPNILADWLEWTDDSGQRWHAKRSGSIILLERWHSNGWGRCDATMWSYAIYGFAEGVAEVARRGYVRAEPGMVIVDREAYMKHIVGGLPDPHSGASLMAEHDAEIAASEGL